MNFPLKVAGPAVLAAMLMLASLAQAGQAKAVAPAPVPTQISSAKRIFLANGGENQPFDDVSLFTGAVDRAYDEFYAAMKASARYDLVGAPANADLLFEIQLTCPKAGPRISQEPNLLGDPSYDPQFRLTIRDPKTNFLLWVFTEHVQWAILQGNRDKNFEQALNRLVADIQAVATRSAAAGDVKP